MKRRDFPDITLNGGCTGEARIVLSLTHDNGIVVTDAAAGVILITVPTDKSKDVDPGAYLDQLRVSSTRT